jgi:hypothetical protein
MAIRVLDEGNFPYGQWHAMLEDLADEVGRMRLFEQHKPLRRFMDVAIHRAWSHRFREREDATS